MKTLGFPRMHKEKGEIRAFLPDFFEKLEVNGAKIYIEEGYGSKMGYTKDDYLSVNKNIEFVSKEESYKQDIIIVLRSPEFDELEFIPDGKILVSMLHYPTRAKRIKVLKRKNIKAVSLDSIRGDFLQRLVFNAKGTSLHGMEIAFSELEKIKSDFYSNTRGPLEVSIIGMGMVGLQAGKAASKFALPEIAKKIKEAKAKGVLINMLPRNITSDREEMIKILKRTDILVDASTRDNPYEYIVDNELLGNLKEEAIILDLTADPYLVDEEGIQVKAIEGIPTGTLDKYVIYKDDKEYYDIPDTVNTSNRRTVVSCDAWPGVKPRECMELYAVQMLPLITKLLEKEFDEMSLESPYYFERAIYRATLDYFFKYDKIKTE